MNKDGAKAAFLTEKGQRILVLAKAAAGKLGLEVDEVCRKFAELQSGLKTGPLEQEVDFHNDHGQRVKHGVSNTVIYEGHVSHLEQRDAGDTTGGTSAALLAHSSMHFLGLLARLPSPRLTTTW